MCACVVEQAVETEAKLKGVGGCFRWMGAEPRGAYSKAHTRR